MRLETERLLLRSLEPADIESELSLWADPQVMLFMGGPRDPERVRRILEDEIAEPLAGPLGQWPLVEKASGAVVGDCGLISKEVDGRSEVELVYVIASSAWGHGYATEVGAALLGYARGELGLSRVVSLIEPGNAASKHVAGKLGMHLETVITRPDGGEREVWVIGTGA